MPKKKSPLPQAKLEIACPRCASKFIYYRQRSRTYLCRHCGYSWSLTARPGREAGGRMTSVKQLRGED